MAPFKAGLTAGHRRELQTLLHETVYTQSLDACGTDEPTIRQRELPAGTAAP